MCGAAGTQPAEHTQRNLPHQHCARYSVNIHRLCGSTNSWREQANSYYETKPPT